NKQLNRAAIEIAVQELQLAADAHPSASSAGRAISYLKPLARWAAKRGLMQKGFQELDRPAERNPQDGGHTVLNRETLAKTVRAGRQIGQLGSLVEVYLQADGNEWLDAPRLAKNLCDHGGRTRRRTTYRKYYPRSQKPREQPTPRDIQ